jgi:hypothetical protein
VAEQSARTPSSTGNVPLAAVAFVSGLVGLLVANLLLGPLAIILGLIALRRDSDRRGRAALGVVLGLADIAVFLLLAAHSGAHQGTLSWNFLGR